MATVTYITAKDGQQLADIDVTTLTRREAHDLRIELRHAVLNRLEDDTDEVVAFYEKKLEEIKVFLGTD